MTSKYRMIWDLMEGQRLMYGSAIAALVLGSCFLYLVPLVPQITMDGVLSSEPEKASAFVQRAVRLGGGRAFLREHLWLVVLCVVALTSIAGVFTYLRGRWSAMLQSSRRSTRSLVRGKARLLAWPWDRSNP